MQTLSLTLRTFRTPYMCFNRSLIVTDQTGCPCINVASFLAFVGSCTAVGSRTAVGSDANKRAMEKLNKIKTNIYIKWNIYK